MIDEFRIYPWRPGCEDCGLTVEQSGDATVELTLHGDFDSYTIAGGSIEVSDKSGTVHSVVLPNALFEDTYFGKSEIALAPVGIALSNKAVVVEAASLSLSFIDGVTTTDALVLLVE